MSKQQYGKRALQAWFSGAEVARIDRFRRGQDDPSWAEAIRDLVQLGLAATGSDEKMRKRSAAAATPSAFSLGS